jgi:type VI secretion system protein ImpA
MASPAVVNVDALIAPIPGENPAGPSVPFAVRQKLDDLRKEVRPEDFAADDPLRPKQAKPADWESIVEIAEQTLGETSKDLLVAARLTEGLAKAKGFAGLRDALTLLRRLYEECWDRLNPVIEDGDVEVRASQINWLDDPDRGARFPTSVRGIPLITDDEATFSWLDWRKAQEAADEEWRQKFDAAVAVVPRKHCQDNVDDVVKAAEELEALKKVLDARLGDNAPGLLEVRRAIADCRTLAQQLLQRKGPGEVAVAETPVAEEEAAAPAENGRPATKGRMGTREEVYEQLAAAAAVLQQIEPHSPIPYLIQRAVELGKLPFPQLIKVLIRDPNILTDLNRELGIKDAEGAGEAES